MDHSSISPSSFERWSNCPASPYLSSISEEQPTHVAALRGTINHEAAESFLYKRSKPEDFLGTVHKVQGHKIIIEQEDLDIIQTYTDYIEKRLEETKGELYLERKFSAGEEIHPELFGTSDATIIYGNNIEIIDLKTGKWKVEPTASQLKIYAVMAIQEFADLDLDKVTTTIVQPKVNPKISSYTHDLMALLHWALNDLKEAAERCFELEPEPCAGDWCRFCPAKDFVCPLHNSGAKDE